MNHIHQSLNHIFERNRLVFWYDPAGEWLEDFNSFPADSIAKITVDRNEFGTKVRIVRDPNPRAKFLLYIPTPKPADVENWLLDLLFQGHEFKADRASLAIHAAGLPADFLHLAEEHAGFFRSEKRIAELRAHLSKHDTPRDIRLKMMAVIADTPIEIDAILLSFLHTAAESALFDPVAETLKSASLVDPFWREIERAFAYVSPSPSLLDFAATLFRAANPLDPEIPLHPHAKVFLQRWKDSNQFRDSYIQWANRMQRDLRINESLDAIEDPALLGDSDTFEAFEKFTLSKLCQRFEIGTAPVDLRTLIQTRRASFWIEAHRHGYQAVEQAIALRELLAASEIDVDSLPNGFTRYTGSWFRIDSAYRRCIFHLREYAQVQLMERIREWVEKAYVNNFLLPLTDRWSDRLRALPSWELQGIPAQRNFFSNYVKPFLDKGQKLFVVVSDAFRFEAAVEFAQRLHSANRWTTEVDAVLGSLPSYTQVGMAALLPGNRLEIDVATGNVSVDAKSATGTPARAEILKSACNGTAIQAEAFLELNTKTEGRALMRDHEVVYIFHNLIDKTGDAAATEARTFHAVEQTFKELDDIVKKIANINGTNILITADHGFLFQQDDVDNRDTASYPHSDAIPFPAQRFALGHGMLPAPGLKIFSAANLGFPGDWSAAFPLSIARFPRQGAGKRYVHGGPSLQEVTVPVVKIRKVRSNDTENVGVEILGVPPKITTGQLSVILFQEKPAVEKILPRELKIGIFSLDGKPLSESKTMLFDSKDPEARNRESSVVIALSNAADAYNNRDVVLRLDETLPGTNQIVTFKSRTLKLQKPFASDFDD